MKSTIALALSVGLLIGVSLGGYASSHFNRWHTIEVQPSDSATDAQNTIHTDSRDISAVDTQGRSTTPSIGAETGDKFKSKNHANLAEPRADSVLSSFGAGAILSDFRQLQQMLTDIEQASFHTLEKVVESHNKSMQFDLMTSVTNKAIFQKMALESPTKLMDWMDRELEGSQAYSGHSLLADAMAALAQYHKAEAEQWLSRRSLEDQTWLSYTFYEQVGKQNPKALLTQLIETDGADEHVYTTLGEWARRAPEAAFEWLQGNRSNPEYASYESLVLESWVEIDPEAALFAIENLQDTGSKNYLLSRYASNMAIADPEQAYQWLLNRPDALDAGMGLNEVLSQWADTDAEGLLLMIQSESDPEKQRELFAAAGPQLVYAKTRDNPQEALDWALSLPEDIQSMIAPTAFEEWLYVEPEQALYWLSTQPNTTTTQQLHGLAVWEMPKHDLDASLASFANLNQRVQTEAVGHIVSELAIQRPTELDAFIRTIENDQVRQRAEQAQSDAEIAANAERHLAELEYLTGDAKMKKMFELFRALGSSQPEAIEQWLSENPMSNTEQRAMEEYAMNHIDEGMYPEDCMPYPGMINSYRY